MPTISFLNVLAYARWRHGAVIASLFSCLAGLRWIYKGLTNNVPRDVFGDPRFASPVMYVVGGIVLQIPLLLYIIFRIRGGYQALLDGL